MELKPSQPPGHARRKLRGLVSEIARLRAEGYTIQAIRQALADAGVEVAWATVQREAARLTQAHPSAASGRTPAATPAHPVEAVTARPQAVSSKVEVDSYFDQHNTNPLFRKKGKA